MERTFAVDFELISFFIHMVVGWVKINNGLIVFDFTVACEQDLSWKIRKKKDGRVEGVGGYFFSCDLHPTKGPGLRPAFPP